MVKSKTLFITVLGCIEWFNEELCSLDSIVALIPLCVQICVSYLDRFSGYKRYRAYVVFVFDVNLVPEFV